MELEQKRFSKLDDGFVCTHCGKKVEPLGYSSRNHCPFCLWSKHLDISPGDRANDCKCAMEPIRVEPDPKKGYVIIYRCQKCGEIHRNGRFIHTKSSVEELVISLAVAHFEQEKKIEELSKQITEIATRYGISII